MFDNSTFNKELFHYANQLIAPVLVQLNIRPRELVFERDPRIVLHAAVLYTGGHIAVNPWELGSVNLATAVGILLHEYGHIKFRTLANGTFREVGQPDERTREEKVREEKYCERFAGFFLALLGFPCAPYIAFIEKTKDHRDSSYPLYHESVQAICSGYNDALFRVSKKLPARPTISYVAAGLLIVAGVFAVGSALSE
jgi:hypothetical protein